MATIPANFKFEEMMASVLQNSHHCRWRVHGLVACLFVVRITCGHEMAIADEMADLYSQAARAFNAHDYQAARKQLGVVLAHPANHNPQISEAQHDLIADATFFMAESLVGLDQYSSAISYYSDYLKKYGPGQRFGRQAMFRRGECAYFIKASQQSIAWLSEFTRKHPQDALLAHALPYLGDLQLQDGNHREAAQYYQRALGEFPTEKLAAECHFGLARCAEATGDLPVARKRYQQMLAAPDQRLRDLAGLHLGLLEYNLDDFTAAQTAFRVALSDHPQSRYRTVIRYWLGLSQLAVGSYSEAAELLDKTAAETGHALAAPASYYSGEALRMSRQYATACERYRQVRRNWPDSQWVADSLCGEIAAALGASQWDELGKLFSELERAHGSSPRFAAARRDYVRGLLRQQRFAPGIELLRPCWESQVASGADSGPDQATAEDGYLLAAAYFGDRQFEKVLEVADSVRPNAGGDQFAESLDLLRASSYLGLERFAAAEAPLRAYLQAHPEGPGAARCRGHLAVALARQGKFEAASEEYEEYVTRDPNHRATLRTTQHLASAAHDAGRRDLAQGWYQTLASAGNPSSFRQAGLQGLAWCQLEDAHAGLTEGTSARRQDVEPAIVTPEDSEVMAESGALALARAVALEASDRSDEARVIYQQYVDRPVDDSDRPAALLGLAKSHESAAQIASAADVLGHFLSDYPQHARRPEALYQSAWCLVELDRWDDAKLLFAELQQDRQGAFWADATYRLAQRAAAERDFASCEQLLDQLLGASTPEAELLQPHGLLLRGQTAAAQAQWPKVREWMQQLMEREPQVTQQWLAEFWVAESYYREQNWDAALAALQGITSHLPADLSERQTSGSDSDRTAPDIAGPVGARDSWLGMVPLRTAQIHAHRELWHEAQRIAKTILQDYPEFEQRYEVDYLLGRCQMAAAEYDEARNAFRRVADSAAGADSETVAMAEWMIGETYLHQQDYERAIRQYLRVEIHAQFPRWQAGGLLQAGKCYEASHDPQSAIEVYARLIERFPNTQFRDDAERQLRALTIPKTRDIAHGG